MYKNVGATGCGVRIDVGVDQCCSAIDVDPPALQAVKARSVPNGVCEKGGDGVQPMRAGGEGEVVVVEVVVPDHDLVVAPLRSSDATREQPVPLCGSPGLTHCGPAARARTCASARAPPRDVESLPSASGARRASSRPGSRPRRRVSSTPPSSDAKLGGHLEKVVGREGQGATPAGPPRVTVPDLLA